MSSFIRLPPAFALDLDGLPLVQLIQCLQEQQPSCLSYKLDYPCLINGPLINSLFCLNRVWTAADQAVLAAAEAARDRAAASHEAAQPSAATTTTTTGS